VLLAAAAWGQGFVYVNDNLDASFEGPNTVSGFSVGTDGALIELPGSPFVTGGSGAISGASGANRVVVSRPRNLLFASNDGSPSISVFGIDPVSGALTPAPGSPFPTAGLVGSGMSLAVTPNGRFLMAGNTRVAEVRVFSVGAMGALTAVPGSPFPLPANTMTRSLQVTADGRLLAVALQRDRRVFAVPGAVAMFTIASDGRLDPVGGSPFPTGGAGVASSVAIDHEGHFLYAGEDTGSDVATVDGFSVGGAGDLTTVPGSPFSPSQVLDSSVAVLSPDGRRLFVSNESSHAISVFSVEADGRLTGPSTPFSVASRDTFPAGLAVNDAGTELFVATFINTIEAFGIDEHGTLSPVAKSPFSTSQPFSLLQSIAFYQPCAAITVTPNPLPTARLGEPYSQSLTAQGGVDPHTFALAGGALPAGIILSPSGLVSGTPTAAGTTSFTVVATDANGCEGRADVTLEVQSIQTDREPPTTTATEMASSALAASAGTSPVVVKLTAVDNPGGSGVEAIFFSLSGAQTGSGSVEGSEAYVRIDAGGTTTLTFYATDRAGNREVPKTFTVTIDRTPPSLTCSATPNLLWPPNHKMVPVTVTVQATDGGSGPAGFVLKAVTASEGGKRLKGHEMREDIKGFVVGAPSTSGWLRAERRGHGSGRLYLLTYTARDAAGNASTCDVAITVPHDHGKKVGHHTKDDGKDGRK
jgi:hypothetical protein